MVKQENTKSGRHGVRLTSQKMLKCPDRSAELLCLQSRRKFELKTGSVTGTASFLPVKQIGIHLYPQKSTGKGDVVCRVFFTRATSRADGGN